jgi:hypothetical protein
MGPIRRGRRAATVATLMVLAPTAPQAAFASPTAAKAEPFLCSVTTPVATVSADKTRAEVSATVTCKVGTAVLGTVPITHIAEGTACNTPTFTTSVADPGLGQVGLSSTFDCGADADGNAGVGFDVDIRASAGISIASASNTTNMSAAAGARVSPTITSVVKKQILPAAQTPHRASYRAQQANPLIATGSVIAAALASIGVTTEVKK